ncbi:Mitogen-activated protein kinase, partial [Gonapodya sp. JEL0774]
MPSNPLPSFVAKRYEFLSTIGAGAYGNVYKCQDRVTGQEVAIKHLAGLMSDRIKARRALREILLLSHLTGNDNVIRLCDIEVPTTKDYTDAFVVLELMETDLHAIIRSGQSLTDQHHQYFIYQLVRGLKWVHSAGIIHRDLKPGNLLVNSDCELK